MKKLQIIFVVVGIFSLMSCEDFLNDLGVEVESNEVTVDFQVLPTDYIGDTTFASNLMESDFDAAIEEAGVSAEDVQSISLKEAVIEISNTDTTITFDYFEFVEATISVDGMEELVIASADSIPQGSRSIECSVSNSDLMDYVTAPEYTISARGKNSKAIDKELNIRGTLKFSIKTNMGLEMN